MLLAIALFWFGRHGYRKSPPMGNIVWLVFQAVGRALKNKFSDKVNKSLTGILELILLRLRMLRFKY